MDGIGWFTYHVCKHLVKNHPQHEFIFVFDRGFHNDFIFGSNVTPHVLTPPARHPFLWYYWFEVGIPGVLKKYKADVFFSPDGYIPLNVEIPTISAIHDINFYHRPGDLPKLTSWFFNTFFPMYAQKATRIITVSEHSRRDIAHHYHVSEEKIDVVYNGASDEFKPLNQDLKKEIQGQYSRGKPYFFFVGTILPRKNVNNLVLAFDRFIEETGKDYHLILAGHHKFGLKELRKTIQTLNHGKRIILPGRVDDDLLPSLMGAAEALTYVPLYEGFGIPVLEAMKCAVPVLTSNVSSLPEVGGNAVHLADPYSVESIKDGMLKLTDADYAKSLIKKGFEQSQKYSWEKTATATWHAIKEVMPEC